MAGYGAAAAKNFIVWMWRKYPGRLRGYALTGGVGDQVGLQVE